MTYLATPADSPLYPPDQAAFGYVPNYTRIFALAPQAYAGWRQLNKAVKDGMDERRYELATLAAARQLDSTYCRLAHAKILADRFLDEAQLLAIEADYHNAGLPAVDVAVMDLAGKVAADPNSIMATDLAPLRAHGLSDVDIMQVVLAACARRFFSAVIAAVGAEPDRALMEGAYR